MANAVTFLTNEDKADYVPDYWKDTNADGNVVDGAKAINERLCEAGRNKAAFLFYSDVHWNKSYQMSPKLLKYLYNHTGMTKTFFGGDIVEWEREREWVEDENGELILQEKEDGNIDVKYLWDWRNQVKDIPNHHSVVGNHDDGQETDNLLSERFVYGYLLGAEETPDIVRGDSGYYYYRDSAPEKTRYLFLDTACNASNQAQQKFIKEALLSTPSGWHIVAVAHIWYDFDYGESLDEALKPNADATNILTMFDAYNERGKVTVTISVKNKNGDYEDKSIEHDFTEDADKCVGWVEYCIGGHAHKDYDIQTTTGIPIILVETDSWRTRDLDCKEGTTTEASVNGIIADYDANKIYVVRVGRGVSRVVTINKSPINALKYAIDKDGTLYGGSYTDTDGKEITTVGWKANTRYGSTDDCDQEASNIHITGYIPVRPNDTVTLQDIYMPDTTGHVGRLFFYQELGGNEDAYEGKTVTDWEDTERDANNNLVKFKVPNKRTITVKVDGVSTQKEVPSVYSYVRIQSGTKNNVIGISNNSVITVSKPTE